MKSGILLSSLCLCVSVVHLLFSFSAVKVEVHRSPIDLVLLPKDRALTANHTSDSVSLINLKQGKVLAEQPVGRKPSAVAVSRDGRRAAVSNLWAGTVSLLEIADGTLTAVAEVKVGPQPRGLVFAPDGNTFFVAIAGAD